MSFFAFGKENLVSTELHFPRKYATPGMTRQVLIKVKLKGDYHTYWKNPGDSGLMPEFIWKGKGYKVKSVHFPTPSFYISSGFINYVYKHEVVFVADLYIEPDAPIGSLNIAADANFLVCKEACIMKTTSFSGTIEIKKGPLMETMDIKPELAQAQAKLPRQGLKYSIKKNTRKVTITFSNPEQLQSDDIFFAPAEDAIVAKINSYKNGVLSFELNDDVEEITGLVISGKQSWIIKD